jgi:hypothetical protein
MKQRAGLVAAGFGAGVAGVLVAELVAYVRGVRRIGEWFLS